MDNEMIKEKIREALENGKVSSIEFYKDGSGAYFKYVDDHGDHGLPCQMASSLRIEDAMQVISGFRLKQHEISTQIKPVLQEMEVGDKRMFPVGKRRSVRTTASDLKTDFKLVFKTWREKDFIIVERKE